MDARQCAGWRRSAVAGSSCSSLANFAGLVADIFLAHSTNQFRRAVGVHPARTSRSRRPSLLAGGLPLRRRAPAVWRDVGHLVGWVGDRRRPRRRRSAPRQPVLLRAHDSQPDLCGAVRRAARVHRPRAAADRQPAWSRRARASGRSGCCCWRSAGSSATSSSASPTTRRTDSSVPPSGCRSSAAPSRSAFCCVPFVVDVTAPPTCGSAASSCWSGPRRRRWLRAARARRPASARPDALRADPSGAPPMAPLLFVNLSFSPGSHWPAGSMRPSRNARRFGPPHRAGRRSGARADAGQRELR